MEDKLLGLGLNRRHRLSVVKRPHGTAVADETMRVTYSADSSDGYPRFSVVHAESSGTKGG